MLPTSQLSIATCWPNHPSMSAFVFYYTLFQRSILSATPTDSTPYKYKDTQAVLVTRAVQLKEAHLPGCGDIYLDIHGCSFSVSAHFLHWFYFSFILIIAFQMAVLHWLIALRFSSCLKNQRHCVSIYLSLQQPLKRNAFFFQFFVSFIKFGPIYEFVQWWVRTRAITGISNTFWGWITSPINAQAFSEWNCCSAAVFGVNTWSAFLPNLRTLLVK